VVIIFTTKIIDKQARMPVPQERYFNKFILL
jgi:hypothetical protein